MKENPKGKKKGHKGTNRKEKEGQDGLGFFFQWSANTDGL